LQLDSCTERFFDGHLRVYSMRLPEIESVCLESAQAQLYLLKDVFGATDGRPRRGTIWPRIDEPGLRGNDKTGFIGCKGFANEAFADLRAI
jgi:hypothetical protein